MYYLNGGIDYNEIVTSLSRPPLSRPWGANHSDDDDGVCTLDGQERCCCCCVTGDYDLIYNLGVVVAITKC